VLSPDVVTYFVWADKLYYVNYSQAILKKLF